MSTYSFKTCINSNFCVYEFKLSDSTTCIVTEFSKFTDCGKKIQRKWKNNSSEMIHYFKVQYVRQVLLYTKKGVAYYQSNR